MRLIDADRLLRHIERAKENNDELDDNIITIIQDMPTEDVSEILDGSGVQAEISTYAFADDLKSQLTEVMSKAEIIALIDSLLK